MNHSVMNPEDINQMISFSFKTFHVLFKAWYACYLPYSIWTNVPGVVPVQNHCPCWKDMESATRHTSTYSCLFPSKSSINRSSLFLHIEIRGEKYSVQNNILSLSGGCPSASYPQNQLLETALRAICKVSSVNMNPKMLEIIPYPSCEDNQSVQNISHA